MRRLHETLALDGIDKQLVRALMQNARQPLIEIARKVGISSAAIHQRLKKLEASGLIDSAQLIIKPEVMGYRTLAFVGIYLDKAMRNSEAAKKLQKIPEVLECHYTTGDWSMLIKVICMNNEHLMRILSEEIQSIEGVSRTETFISLNQQIDRQLSI